MTVITGSSSTWWRTGPPAATRSPVKEDAASQATASTANLSGTIPAGTTVLGGLGALLGQYTPIVATLIVIEPADTISITVAIVIDGDAGTCAVDGVETTAT